MTSTANSLSKSAPDPVTGAEQGEAGCLASPSMAHSRQSFLGESHLTPLLLVLDGMPKSKVFQRHVFILFCLPQQARFEDVASVGLPFRFVALRQQGVGLIQANGGSGFVLRVAQGGH